MTYRARTGMNYIPEGGTKEIRVEAGEIAEGVPAKALPWLLEQGHLVEEAAPEAAKAARKAKE